MWFNPDGRYVINTGTTYQTNLVGMCLYDNNVQADAHLSIDLTPSFTVSAMPKMPEGGEAPLTSNNLVIQSLVSMFENEFQALQADMRKIVLIRLRATDDEMSKELIRILKNSKTKISDGVTPEADNVVIIKRAEKNLIIYVTRDKTPVNGFIKNLELMLSSLEIPFTASEGSRTVKALEAKYVDHVQAYRKESVKRSVIALITNNRKQLERNIQYLERTVSDTQNALDKYLVQLKQKRRERIIEEQEMTDGGELTTFLLNNRAITDVSLDEGAGCISMVINTPLTHHDKEDLRLILRHTDSSRFIESMMGNTTSEFRRGSGEEDAKKHRHICTEIYRLMQKVFIEEKYIAHATTRWSLMLATPDDISHIEAYREGEFTNPHLTFARCFGSYRSKIAALMGKGQYEMAVQTLISACSNMNWQDSSVFRAMQRMLVSIYLNETAPCFEDMSTGELLTMQQVIDKEGLRCTD